MKTNCTGCQRGLPITELGMHHDESGIFKCTRARYQMALEPKSRDAWFEDRPRNEAWFRFGGGV